MDLLCGLTPRHIRRLCDPPTWDSAGGFGYRPKDVSELTLDQVFMLLADPKYLRAGPVRGVSMDGSAVANLLKPDGTVDAVSSTGEKIKLKGTGKTKVEQMREKQAKRAAERSAASERKGRKKRNRNGY